MYNVATYACNVDVCMVHDHIRLCVYSSPQICICTLYIHKNELLKLYKIQNEKLMVIFVG